MKRILHAGLTLLALVAAAPALGAEVTFFELEAFRGRSFAASQTIPNFADIGFNDRALSVIVRSGDWQLCSDAYFRGRCVTIGPGEYPSLRSLQLENQVSSAREMEWLGDGRRHGGGGGPARVELFGGYGFGGPVFVLTGTINNMSDVGFNDRAKSMIVHEGEWEGCEHADFRGMCQRFIVGRYPNLAQFSDKISSMRLLGDVGAGNVAGGAAAINGWGTGARAVLYEGANLVGRSFVINNEVVSNFANTGFNDRASSMRIEAGYWLFCSDAGFGGECMTFGPGDYPTLPWGLTHRISSGRRINLVYPYRQNPVWQR